MKKPDNRTKVTNVTAMIDDFPLLEKLIEKLSYRRCDISFRAEVINSDLLTIDTSSVEAYVSGNFLLPDNRRSFAIPFTSCFFFTCTRGYEGIDKLAWSNSLS